MSGQSIVYVYKIESLFFFTKIVYKGWMGGKKGQNSVYVVIEWPLGEKSTSIAVGSFELFRIFSRFSLLILFSHCSHLSLHSLFNFFKLIRLSAILAFVAFSAFLAFSVFLVI